MKSVQFFLVGIGKTTNEVTNLSVNIFFDKLSKYIKKDEIVKRNINGKDIRIFDYYKNFTNQTYVIPFGLYRDNKPMTVKDVSSLEDIDGDAIEPTFMYYDDTSRIAMVTYNHTGLKARDIENYLSTFFEEKTNLNFLLIPITLDRSLENIRQSEQVKSITLSLDVGKSYHDLIKRNIQTNDGILKQTLSFIDSIHNSADNNVFTMTLAVGRKRDSTLDMESILTLVSELNIDSNCIKEVTVNYKNKKSGNIDIAKLKDNSLLLKKNIQGIPKIGAEYLLNNGEEFMKEKRKYYFNAELEFMNKLQEYNEEYVINERYD